MIKRLFTSLTPLARPLRIAYPFSKRAKDIQLILHTPEQVDQMLIRNEQKEKGMKAKPKPWKSGV